MKNALFASIVAASLVGVFALTASAQVTPTREPKPPQPAQMPAPGDQPVVSLCPTLNMTGPPTAVFAPQAVTFTIALAGGEAGIKPFYNWSVSAGSITSGQGTQSIKVDTADTTSNGSITASVFITGYAPSCTVFSDATVEIKVRPVSRKFDEYAELKPSEEEAKLEAALSELQFDPENRLYFIVYRSAKTKPGVIEPILQRAMDYFVTKRGIPMERVERIYGERREPAAIEIWIVPSGAGAPKPTVTPVTKTAAPPPPKKP